jgi:hypothetical protein
LLPSLLGIAVMSVLLTGCSLFSPKPSTTTGAASPPVSAASAASAATPTPGGRSVTTGTTTSAAPSATATRTGRCQTSQLSATLTTGAGAGAGHQFPYLVLTNTGATACTLTGYPGVSFVYHGNGTQLGAAADREAGGIAITTITLAPGFAAHSQLNIAAAGNYDPATCQLMAIDGVRVYPPDQTVALFVETTAYQGCVNATVKLLVVRPLETGAA